MQVRVLGQGAFAVVDEMVNAAGARYAVKKLKPQLQTSDLNVRPGPPPPQRAPLRIAGRWGRAGQGACTCVHVLAQPGDPS